MDTSTTYSSARKGTFYECLIAGGLAGTAVDTILFPLDTVKTRLQSPRGFHASGGFHGILSGLVPAVIGSAPTAAAFFVTYEYMKAFLSPWTSESFSSTFVHMIAASTGEISACVVRVPTEVVKQRLQAKLYSSTWNAIWTMYRTEGILGFYRGYFSTVLREIPFTCIQFPLYEVLKKQVSKYKQLQTPPEPFDAAICGSIAGGVAASVTTPLDVIKTRVMLDKQKVVISS
ncbi:hypothetical protein HMI55_002783 [Coelomomyces lativittatus]|nr:hypothetical protein HMI55_002783 [Coelomomyces lativittatus]